MNQPVNSPLAHLSLIGRQAADSVQHTGRVVIATPVLLLGGTEMHLLALVEALVHGGYLVTVCCYCEYDEAIVAEVEGRGAEVVLLRVPRDSGRLGIAGVHRLARRFLAVMREVRPDVVHVQYLAPGLIPVILARLAGRRKVFATVHIAGREFYGWKARLLLRAASTLCSAFFCVSQAVESFWFGSAAMVDPSSQGRRRHFTIYNSVPSGRIEEIGRATDRCALRRELGVGDSPVVGFVGRLSHQKGLSYLVTAFAAVVQAVPGVKLVVVGDGPERAVLERELQERGLRDRALLLSAQARDRVFSYLTIFDVLAVPSLYEGFGLIAAEAGAAGVPVVASAVAGLSEVVEDEVTGLLVAPGDSERLAAALIRLLSEPGRRSAMGEAARESVRRRFSFGRFQSATLAAYRRFYVGAHATRRS
jgi:glycosyltransferase involved in cell wall biosynthesis